MIHGDAFETLGPDQLGKLFSTEVPYLIPDQGEDGHEWMLDEWFSPEYQQNNFTRRCARCKVAYKVVLSDTQMYALNGNHHQYVQDMFGKAQPPVCVPSEVADDSSTPLSGTWGDSPLPSLRKMLPGLSTEVLFPCKCTKVNGYISDVIIHLNDRDNWTREAIADWLETLDVDLSFQVESDS